MSSIDGYTDYQRREYCKDVRCPIQLDLESKKEGSAEYDTVRNICKISCKHTTCEFHHWLIDNGYLLVKKEG